MPPYPAFSQCMLFPSLLLAFACFTVAAPVDIHISTDEVLQWFEQEFHGIDNGTFIQNLVSEGFSEIEAQWNAQVQCYAIPTGVIAWISLILTGWTIYCHAADRKPLKFWSTARIEHGAWGIALSLLTGGITIPLPAFTAYRCRGSWQLICISVYQLTNVVTLTVAGFHRSFEALRKTKPRQGVKDTSVWIWFWMFLYTTSFVAGNTGLFNIVKELIGYNRNIFIISVSCGGTGVLLTAALMLAYCVFAKCLKKRSKAIGFLWLILVVILFCSGSLNEWTLSAIKRNMLGVPSGKSQIPYWLFFAGKKLLLFAV